MPPIKFNMTARDTALMNTIKKQGKEIDKLQKKFDKSGKTGAKSFKGVAGELKNVASSLIGPVGVGAAVGMLVMNVKSAYSAMLAAHMEYANKIKETGKARGRGLWNSLAAFDGDRGKLDKYANKVARDAKAPLARVYDILGAGVTSGGRGESLLSSATRAAQLERLGVGGGEALVTGGITLSQITKNKNADVNFGFLQEIGTASKVTELDKQLNLIKGIKALTQEGLSPEKAAEFTASTNQLMLTDKEGRRTSTGIVNLAKKVGGGELMPTQTTDAKTGKLKTTWSRIKGGSFEQKLKNWQDAYAKADDDLKKDMIQKYAPEATFNGAFRDIISRSGAYKKQMAESARIIHAPGKEGANLFRSHLSATTSGTIGTMTDAVTSADATLDNRAITTKAKEAAAVEADRLFFRYMKQSSSALGYAMHSGRSGFANIFNGPETETKGYREQFKQQVESSSRQKNNGQVIWTEHEKDILEALNKLVKIAEGNANKNNATAKNTSKQQRSNGQEGD